MPKVAEDCRKQSNEKNILIKGYIGWLLTRITTFTASEATMSKALEAYILLLFIFLKRIRYTGLRL